MQAHTEGKADGHWLLEEARLRNQALKQALSDRKQQMEAAARQAAAAAQAEADKLAEVQSQLQTVQVRAQDNLVGIVGGQLPTVQVRAQDCLVGSVDGQLPTVQVRAQNCLAGSVEGCATGTGGAVSAEGSQMPSYSCNCWNLCRAHALGGSMLPKGPHAMHSGLQDTPLLHLHGLSVGQAAASLLHACPTVQLPTVCQTYCWQTSLPSLPLCLLQAQKLEALAAKVDVDHRLAALQRRFDGLQMQHAESEKAVLLAQVCQRDGHPAACELC